MVTFPMMEKVSVVKVQISALFTSS
jgi:hypothetical protein